MSRSYKNYIGHYIAYGARPSQGKKYTSRVLRRTSKESLINEQLCFDFCHIQDISRGNKGSKSKDFGWNYFGDGFNVYFKGTEEYNKYCQERWFVRAKRK